MGYLKLIQHKPSARAKSTLNYWNSTCMWSCTREESRLKSSLEKSNTSCGTNSSKTNLFTHTTLDGVVVYWLLLWLRETKLHEIFYVCRRIWVHLNGVYHKSLPLLTPILLKPLKLLRQNLSISLSSVQVFTNLICIPCHLRPSQRRNP
jgi:hypothetical protein